MDSGHELRSASRGEATIGAFGFGGLVRYLGGLFTEKALRTMKDRGLIPHKKLGRRVVFVRAEVDRWLDALPGLAVEEAVSNLDLRTGDEE